MPLNRIKVLGISNQLCKMHALRKNGYQRPHDMMMNTANSCVGSTTPG